MVVVRESPRAQQSPTKNTTQWPPKSPFQALLSSPSGRKKWQDRQSRAEERSPSPSPIKKSVRSSQKLQELAEMDDEDEDEEDEEDEETLQLKLQEIQAKLRLKKLQSKGKKVEGDSSGRESRQERASSPKKRNVSPTTLYKAAVEVPVSPVRQSRPVEEQMSPARRRLGLTSSTRAEDVSLKRARDGSQIKRSSSSLQRAQREELPRPKSFSERLAQGRSDAEEKQAKKERLEKMRSTGFNHTKADTPSRQEPATNGRISRLTADDKRPSSAGRLQEGTPKNESAIARSASARTPREKEAKPHARALFNPGAYGQTSGTGHAGDDSDASLEIEDNDNNDDSWFDPFSKTHLKKRHIEHSVVAREMEGKEIYSVPRLLKDVKSPDYDPPDCESDFVVFAILSSKSQPFSHAETHKTAEQAKEDYATPRNKFMVLHLTDLKWEIDCFLFGSAFNQFWKLTPGTLLAILNPAILPPKGNQNNGRFSLKLGSSEDAVMEIGIARDLGYCSAVKKDGQPCGEWINKRRTEACEFHISLQIEKNRKGRMEVNTMFRGAGNPQDKIKSRVAKEGRNKKFGGTYHREYGQLYSVPGGGGRSAASLMDADDTDALHNMNQEEASRKRIADAQKERDLAKKLGEMGRGVGAEYMRTKAHQHTNSTTTVSSTASKANASEEARNALFNKPSAADLGLLGKKASDARLSPSKDRKKHFGLGALSMTNGGSSASKTAEPLGWGGARKAGILQPKESRLGSPERGQTKLDIGEKTSRPRSQDSSLRSAGSSSPVKKKARFVLEKGIREPGRDSLPGAGAPAKVEDDDDDDLDIV